MQGPATTQLSAAEARSLAAELIAVGFPLLAMDALRQAHPIAQTRFSRWAVEPAEAAASLVDDDPLTFRSSAVADLTAGPVAVHLPDAGGRHISLTVFDSAGEPFAAIGTHTWNSDGCDVAIVAPGWRGTLEPGVRACRAPSDLVWLVCRIATRSEADLADAAALAARMFLILGHVGRAPDAGTEPVSLSLLRAIGGTPVQTMLHRLPPLLARAPRALRQSLEPAVKPRMDRLGSFEARPPQLQAAIGQGVADTLNRLAASTRTQMLATADWAPLSPLGSDADADAIAAAAGWLLRLGAPAPSDICFLTCGTDESGRALTGEERYRIRLPPGGAPPGRAGWRLSASALRPGADPGPYVLIGPIDAHARDTEFDIALEPRPPTRACDGWLPTPAGPYRLTMRLYAPHPSALGGEWRMPPVERLGSRGGGEPAPGPS